MKATCLCLMAIVITACSSLSIRPTATFILLPPAEGPAARSEKQIVTLIGGGRKQSLISVIRITRASTTLQAVSATGQNIIRLSYDGRQLTESAAPTIDLPGRTIMALVQFAQWPEQSLERRYLADNGWTLVLAEDIRELYYSDVKQLTVSYASKGILHIDNHRDNYKLDIETLNTTEL